MVSAHIYISISLLLNKVQVYIYRTYAKTQKLQAHAEAVDCSTLNSGYERKSTLSLEWFHK